MSFRAIALSITSILVLLVSVAFAQQPAITASTPCNALNRGTVNCPTYTASSTTAVPRAPMDGSMTVPSQTSTTLFNGAVPPNGFMVELYGVGCFVNDNGPANGVNTGSSQAGFYFAAPPSPFVTPPGYKPMGVVNVWCNASNYIAARGW